MHDYLDEHQLLAVRALEKLQNICDNHNIQFFLLAGTTLGAVRHEGMIPWDDDIDVGFCRKEYDEVRKYLIEELDDGFEYVDEQAVDNFPRLFGKILYKGHSCVDVFLIAKWHTGMRGKIQFRIHKFAVDMYKISLNYKTPGRPNRSLYRRVKTKTILAVEKVIYMIIKIKYKKMDFIRLARWNENYFERHKSDCYINLYSVYSMEKEIIKTEWINQTSTVTFEGKIYNTVGDVDAYLTKLYGNYMVPPSEDKRKKIHQETF